MATKRTTQLIAGGLAVAVVGVLAATVVSRSGTREVTIPAGTRIVGKLQQTVTTEGSPIGRGVEIRAAAPIELYEDVSLPPGVALHGEITHAKGGGRIAGSPELTIRFTRLEVDGQSYPVVAEPFRVRGKNDAGESAALIGGGAVAGGVIGAIAGSTVKGAVVGAVIGTGVAVATPGNQITLPTGQRLRVTLREPVTVRFRPVEPEAEIARDR